MAHGRKTGGRQKGARNRATAEARAAAEATGILPLDYMLSVLRDANADHKRRDAMATAAAPYLHSKLSAIDAKPNGEGETQEAVSVTIRFIEPPASSHEGQSRCSPGPVMSASAPSATPEQTLQNRR